MDEKRMIKCIGISGCAGSGKNLVADYIKSQVNCSIKAFADPIKQIAQIFGFTYEQCHNQDLKNMIDDRWGFSPRTFMQKLGDAFRDTYGEDVFIKILDNNRNKNELTIIPDVRFENELKWILEHDGIVIHVERDHSSNLSEKEQQHKSEKCLFNKKVLQNFKDYRTPFQISPKVYGINNLYTKEELFHNVKNVLNNLELFQSFNNDGCSSCQNRITGFPYDHCHINGVIPKHLTNCKDYIKR